MDHKIKPTATRLGIISTWSTIAYYNSTIQDIIIRELIKNIFLKKNFLISNIGINKLPDYYIISFVYYPYKRILLLTDIYFLLGLLKGLLEKLLHVRIYFHVVQIPSMVHNAQILSAWIEKRLMLSPKLHKSILLRVLIEYKKWSHY